MWNKRNSGKPKTCTIKECANPYIASGYCSRHYAQNRYYGGIKSRTRYDPNEAKFYSNEVAVYITHIDEKVKCFVDIPDYQLVKDIKWSWHNGYAIDTKRGVFMHNLLMGEKGVDHINGNRMDNRRANLRLATNMQNSWNSSGSKSKKSSIYKGVHSCNMTKKPWRAYIKKDGNNIFIGRFHSEKEAASMYDQYANQLFGDYAKTNFEYV